MSLLILLPIGMGLLLGTQTAINSRLRAFVGSPYIASAISFTVGTLFLLSLTAIKEGLHLSISGPWWAWLGGLLGTIALTTNILLFPKLGSVQTAVLPIFGQIFASLIIDQYGLFASVQTKLTWIKLPGLLLVLAGVLLTVVEKNSSNQRPGHVKDLLAWQLAGILAGMLGACQIAINGHLGQIQHSPLVAASYSFASGAIILWLVCLFKRHSFTSVKATFEQGPRYWWIWLGGFFGALYVFGSAFLVTKIGTSQIVIFALFGQLSASALIEHFGLLESQPKPVHFQKICGLILLFIGVIITKLV